MQPAPIDPRFVRRIVDVFGELGKDWIERLPRIVDACARRWELHVAPPFAPLSYNYVAPVVRADGSRAVLKVGVPARELTTELEALRLYGGRSSVRLLAADPDIGAMLLERLVPGTSLVGMADDVQATHIAAVTMRALWRPLPAEHPFPSIDDWARGYARMRGQFGGSSGPLPESLLTRAETLSEELLASSAEPVLLHGDLHHDNILQSGDGSWLAIDPKGLAGEPVYDTGSWLRNWCPDLLQLSDPRDTLERRIRQFAEELDFDPKRIHAWAFAQVMLSAVWSAEDHGSGWESGVAVAELLLQIKP